MHNNPNLDLVKVNASAKFDQIPSICPEDILSRNKILMLTKGHNCVQNLIKFHGLVHKILSQNEILMLIMGNNSVVNL